VEFGRASAVGTKKRSATAEWRSRLHGAPCPCTFLFEELEKAGHANAFGEFTNALGRREFSPIACCRPVINLAIESDASTSVQYDNTARTKALEL
jgi:hypothetical protein